MYDNWFAKLIMQDSFSLLQKSWGPFTYYDMFSLRGVYYFIADCLNYTLFVLFELIWIRDRILTNDWTLYTIEIKDRWIDMNRLLVPYDLPHDKYDFDYWSNLPNGVDCNGNKGQGFFCYCPS